MQLPHLAATWILAAAASAQDWPTWRGPNHDGSTEATGLPTDFDKEKHVAWAVDLPGPAASTPIVVGERVYLTSIEEEAGALLALCVDVESGEVLWERNAGSGYRAGGAGTPVRLHDRSNYASPSPVSDGERVVFFFGNGDLVCFTPDGERVWARNMQKDYGDFAFQWTFSASPTLWEGRLYLQVLQRNEPVHDVGEPESPSFLLALDPRSGDELFRHLRPSDARVESLESYATPIPYVGASGRKELLVAGGDVITGHDPKTGEELWRWGTWNPGHREIWWRLVPSAVTGAGVVLVCAPKTAPVFAVRLDGSGELGEAGLAWKSDGRPNRVSSDVPTPLYYEGRFYVLSDVRESLARIVPETGAIDWVIDMPGKKLWRASPTGADGKVWCMNHGGDVVVVDAENGKIVNQIAMGEEDDDGTRSTIAIAHGRLFIRTNSKLFCVGRGGA